MDRIGKAEANPRQNRVDAIAAGLVDDAVGVLDDVGVVAGAAQHRVDAPNAIEIIVAATPCQYIRTDIANNRVVEIFAGPVDRSAPQQGQLLVCPNSLDWYD